MERVQFVNHARDVVDGVVHARILVFEVHFVADDPGEQGRMVAITQHDFPRFLELPRYGFLVVVVEAVPLAGDFDAKRDRQAKLVRNIEHAAVARPPGAH